MSDTDLAILLDRLVRRLHADLQRKAPSFDPHRVGPGGGMMLLTLAELGEVPMHELARTLVRDKAQVTREVRGLETKGMVQRTASTVDQRVVLLSLTSAGAEFVETIQKELAETVDDQLGLLDDNEKRQLQTLLATAVGPASPKERP